MENLYRFINSATMRLVLASMVAGALSTLFSGFPNVGMTFAILGYALAVVAVLSGIRDIINAISGNDPHA